MFLLLFHERLGSSGSHYCVVMYVMWRDCHTVGMTANVADLRLLGEFQTLGLRVVQITLRWLEMGTKFIWSEVLLGVVLSLVFRLE